MPKCDFNIIELMKLGMITYGVHENCPIFKTPHLFCLSTYLHPKLFHALDLERPNKPPLLLQMITNQLKGNIIQGWLLYVIRSFLQVNFRIYYQLINFVWLSFDFFSFSRSLTICFHVALYSCVCGCPKISRNVFYL